MSATNHTTNLSLSQFVNTDVPAWRQDYNGDMLKIDNAYTADISSATAETSADPSDYMKFYDVSATTNKKILISDLLKGAKVEDLTDTDITTPANNDGLVYDATAQKWENKPVVTGDLWAQNGAHNLCPFPYYSGGTQIIANLTITVGSKGEMTASGASDGDGNFIFYSGTLKKNTYKCKFKGTFTGDNLVLRLYDSTADIIIGDVSGNNEITFQVDATNENHNFALYINWTGAQSITISGRPLLKLASDPTDDDTPYAMTNEELTDGLSAKADNYIHDASTDSYIFTMKTVNNIAQGYVGVSQMKFSPSLGKIFFYSLDGTYMGETTYTPAT